MRSCAPFCRCAAVEQSRAPAFVFALLLLQLSGNAGVVSGQEVSPPLSSSSRIEVLPPAQPRDPSNLPGDFAALGTTTEPIVRLPQQAFTRLSAVQAEKTPFNDFLKALTSQAKLNAIASDAAGETIVTVNLHDVTVIDALDAVTKANGLFYRVDPQSGIFRIATIEEYERDLASFREEKIRVFTLLYPNPFTVAQAIQQIYGERVQLNTADSDFADLFEIQQRLSRFDLLSQRSSFSTAQGAGVGGVGGGVGGFGGGLGGFGGGMGGLGGGMGGFGDGMGGFGGGLGGFGGGMGGFGGLPGQGTVNQALIDLNQQLSERLRAEEIQELENALQSGADPTQTKEGEELLKRGRATIQISVIRRNNQIVVRTSDDATMEAISALIAQLDVPTPIVLLEVKIMNVVLGDGFNSAFDYQFGTRNGTAGQFVSLNGSQNGNIGPFQPATSAQSFPAIPQSENTIGTSSQQLGGTGILPGAFAFQIIDSHFRARMQLLETRNRVTSLATPVILTANNEVSRIFVGQTVPVRVGVNAAQAIPGAVIGGGGLATAASINTQLQDIGQSILITPNINADRTVTLRLVVETSELGPTSQNVAVFPVDGSDATSASLDIVNRRNASGTIVAQDGMAVVLGGLVNERVRDTRAQVPVLGRLPVVGTLFRRQTTERTREELVIVVRPYVFNTPTESAATSQEWMCEHALHPNSPHAAGDMNSYNRCEVVKPDPDCNRRANLLRLHNVVPKNY